VKVKIIDKDIQIKSAFEGEKLHVAHIVYSFYNKNKDAIFCYCINLTKNKQCD
jgi:hypothetical protein